MRKTIGAGCLLLIGAGLSWRSALMPPPQSAQDAPTAAPDPQTRRWSVVTAPSPVPSDPAAVYRSGERMVSAAAGAIDEIAADYGLTVERAPGRSGYAVLSGDTDALDQLQDDPRVFSAGPHARIFGADLDDDDDDGLHNIASLKWHEDLLTLPRPDITVDFSDIVIAVLDTGVAFENVRGTFTKAASMEGVSIVAPYDFVNDDSQPNDDHQHGTHIASLIVGTGAVAGVAPGATLMPLKVLDADNTGGEVALIDAIWWAVDNGADIINMSLTFGLDYAPSPALLEALDSAQRAGVVLIGATGNDGADEIGWPAASPAVIAVGSACVEVDGTLVPAPYSNTGPQMDVMAPGGCLDRDANGDGVPDGMIAETIDKNNPGQTDHWLYAGTSQAAAVTSGAAAWLLKSGASPGEVPLFLQYAAERLPDGDFASGLGAGMPNILTSVAVAHDYAHIDLSKHIGYHTAMLPFLLNNADGTVSPGVRLETINANLEPVYSATVYARVQGASSAKLSCELTPEHQGVCFLMGPPVDPTEVDAPAWLFTIDAVTPLGLVAFRPGSLMFASDGLEAFTAHLNESEELYGALPALYWPAGALGNPAVAEAYAVVNSGTGIATSPMGVLFPPPSLEPVATVAPQELELEGTGIATSPLRFHHVSFTGTGIATSPLSIMLRGKELVAIEGTGIATSPMSPLDLYTSTGKSAACTTCTFQADPMLLSTEEIASGVGAESALAVQLEAGGWVSDEGYAAATLVGSSLLSEDVDDDALSTASLGAMRLDLGDLLGDDDDDD